MHSCGAFAPKKWGFDRFFLFSLFADEFNGGVFSVITQYNRFFGYIIDALMSGLSVEGSGSDAGGLQLTPAFNS